MEVPLYEKLAVMPHVLQITQMLIITRCCFARDGHETYRELFRTCIAIVLLIKPIFLGDVLVAFAIVVCLKAKPAQANESPVE